MLHTAPSVLGLLRAFKDPLANFKFRPSDPDPSFPPSLTPSTTLSEALRSTNFTDREDAMYETNQRRSMQAVLERYRLAGEERGGGSFSSLIGPLSALELLVTFWTDLATKQDAHADGWTLLLRTTAISHLPSLTTSLQSVASQNSERALQTWEETVNRIEADVERRNEADVLDQEEEEDENGSLEDETLGAGTVLDACLVSL